MKDDDKGAPSGASDARTTTRIPLLHKAAAERGELVHVLDDNGKWIELPAATAYLRELAGRLRNKPTPDECEAAAALFERMADDTRAHKAAGLVPKGRPAKSRYLEIGEAVEDLRWGGVTVTDARKRVARKHGLSVSRVKALHLEYLRGLEPC